MRTLFLSPRQCWPALGGAKLREYHLLKALSCCGPVTYIYFADPGDPPLTAAELPFCERIVAVVRPETFSPFKIVRGLVGRWPLHVLNYQSEHMNAALAGLPKSPGYDLLHVDSIHMIRYVKPLTQAFGARTVYDWHNIESEAVYRYADSAPSPAHRWYAQSAARKLQALEHEILHAAFGHLVCSPREQVTLRAIAPQARIRVVENGVDAPYFAQTERSAAPKRIVYVGKMDYHANAAAAVDFTTKTWPAIYKSLPRYTLAIVGTNPLPPVQALATLPGVEVTGTVPDLRPYYADALAAVVPLRIGGGTRLKILEAMAARVPVISTTLGAEGLPVTPDENILIAEAGESAAWIRHLSALAASRDLDARLTANGFELVKTRYDWSTILEAAIATYRDWMRNGE